MREPLLKIIMAFMLVLTVTSINPIAQVSSGGSYTLHQAVISGGGGTSTNAPTNTYRIEGTAGQTVVGIFSDGSPYTLRAGFWAPEPLGPTAAGAKISGRALGPTGQGLPNVTFILSGGALTESRIARTNSFGYFSFEDVEVGQAYLLTAQSRRYGFANNPQVIVLMENVSDMVFQASWEN